MSASSSGSVRLSVRKNDAKRADKTRDGPQSLPAGLYQVSLNAAGIEVGASSHFVAVPEDRWKQPVREFDAYTADLYRLADWLVEGGIDTVAMESTGVYWIPLFGVLEERGFEVILVDPRRMKNVPGCLKDRLPLWEPGGELQQFRPLLGPLRVEEVGTAAELIEPELATEDEDLSDLFRSALQQFQDDLSRNDPQLATGARMPWDLLGRFSVHVHPSLSLGVTTGREGAGVLYKPKVAAKVDRDRGIFFVQNPTELSRVDSGGRAIAALFDGDPRRLAQAWRAACDQAESGRLARVIELAEQRTQREQAQTEQQILERTAKFREGTAAKHRDHDHPHGRSGITSSSSVAHANEREDTGSTVTLASHRVLVDPDSLMLVDPLGKLEKQEPTPRPKTTGDGRLAEPRPGTGGPRGGLSIRLYSDLDRETVGQQLLRKVLSSDHDEIEDLRAQRGVGADAIDELGRFYEMKVSAGPEPDQVTLTNAEVKRALTTPDFFLVVVSGVEGVDAKPKVRVIVNPLSQLQPTESGSITLSGVQSVTSLTYGFAHIIGPAPDGGGEELDAQAVHK